MKINNIQVYNLEESIKASGLPMRTGSDKPEVDYKRGKNLGNAKVGSGHDCFLKGIMVHLEIEATLKWFDQFDRYAFQDTISSTSQMHRITKFNLDNQFHKYVDEDILKIVKEWVEIYEDNPTPQKFERIIYNVPQGFLYTRAISTNYLQLKTMYYQRRNHKLQEWRDFCKELEKLPKFKELALGGGN